MTSVHSNRSRRKEAEGIIVGTTSESFDICSKSSISATKLLTNQTAETVSSYTPRSQLQSSQSAAIVSPKYPSLHPTPSIPNGTLRPNCELNETLKPQPVHGIEAFAPITVPEKARGTGFYFKNHPHAKPWIRKLADYVLDALNERLEVEADRPFVLADYGCADGQASLPIVSSIIDTIRQNYGNLSVIVYYEDRHENDFSSIFSIQQGLAPGANGALTNFLAESKDVFPVASGINFYSQCAPDGFINFGITSAAAHWLSKRPCVLNDSIKHTSNRVTGLERNIFAEQAARDWERFLLLRSRELRKGGCLTMCVLCYDEALHPDGNARGKAMCALWDDVLLEMETDDIISHGERRNITFNAYFRTEEELRAPFEQSTTLPGLTLDVCEMRVFPCPVQEKYAAACNMFGVGSSEELKARKMLSKMYEKGMRIFMHRTLLAGLDTQRTDLDKKLVTDEFYGRVVDGISTEPKKYAIDTVVGYLVVRKN